MQACRKISGHTALQKKEQTHMRGVYPVTRQQSGNITFYISEQVLV